MHYLVTGGAGFIGSNLCERLLKDGHAVTAFDNFSTGFEQFVQRAQTDAKFSLVRGDILDQSALRAAMRGVDFVFHLSANADVRFGTDHPERDLEQNTVGTFNVLEAMRLNDVKCIAFSSTGSIYGEPEVFPTPETAPFPVQTSLYGASKLAGEGLIQAYAHGFGFKTWIFRFVSVLGERYTHGHVFDFYKKLLTDPTKLSVLGNGKQRKSYMYVQDCIEAMLIATSQSNEPVNIFNLGTAGYIEVMESIGWICEWMGIQPKLSFSGGERGWIGDSPFIFLDTTKIQKLGWKPKASIQAGVIKTLEWLAENKWVLEARS